MISDIKESRSSLFGGRRAWRLGSVLMPLQIAFSVVVVLIATLLSASLVRALTQNNGFRLSGTLFIETTMPGVLTEKTDKQENKIKAELAVYHAINERLNHAPGIVSASVGKVHPLGMATYGGAFRTVGAKDIRSDREITENWVAPRYFETVGTQLLRGRDFARSDSHDSQKVCILSAAAARNFFPNGDPVGRSLVEVDEKQAKPITVIGVVEDTRWNSLHDAMPRMIYIPLDQETGFLQSMEIVVRTNDDAVAMNAVRTILREEAGAQVTDVVSIRDAVNGSLGQSRLLATLSNMLAGLALLLSAIAIYGLLSYSVKQRTSEIAVRMAVGATRADVIGMFVRQASALVLPGVLLGVAAAFGVARLISSLLYQTRPADPWGFCLGVGTLMAVGLIASYFPAHRASRVEPMQALRSE